MEGSHLEEGRGVDSCQGDVVALTEDTPGEEWGVAVASLMDLRGADQPPGDFPEGGLVVEE